MYSFYNICLEKYNIFMITYDYVMRLRIPIYILYICIIYIFFDFKPSVTVLLLYHISLLPSVEAFPLRNPSAWQLEKRHARKIGVFINRTLTIEYIKVYALGISSRENVL